jgi:hypothetical protein
LPGWDILRALGGEVAEVSAFTVREEIQAEEPVLLAGRFEGGAVFQISLLPGQRQGRLRLTAIGAYGRADLVFSSGWPGAGCLEWQAADGPVHEEKWAPLDPWPGLVAAFEEALANQRAMIQAGSSNSTGIEADRQTRGPSLDNRAAQLTWQAEVRSLELDDAARRSVQRRRVSTLEYPEPTEEVGFKGTMTLTGCTLLWLIIFLLVVSIWLPPAGWLILPVLAIFLLLQLFRWLLPRNP